MPSPSPSNVSNRAQTFCLKRILHGRLCVPRGFQVIAAVGAELVGFGNFALALGAGGAQVAFTVRAEIEPRAHCASALWAGIWQWLAHQEIDDHTKKGERPRKKQRQ